MRSSLLAAMLDPAEPRERERAEALNAEIVEWAPAGILNPGKVVV